MLRLKNIGLGLLLIACAGCAGGAPSSPAPSGGAPNSPTPGGGGGVAVGGKPTPNPSPDPEGCAAMIATSQGLKAIAEQSHALQVNCGLSDEEMEKRVEAL